MAFGKRSGEEQAYNNDGFEELDEKDFIKEVDEPYVTIKFFTITEEMKIKEIVEDIRLGNVMLFIDVSAIMDDSATLRIFVNKIRRVADEHSITMKLYGKNWLLILPNIVTFRVGDE